jgi:hypothetical protein
MPPSAKLGQQRGGVRIDTGQQPLGGLHKGHGDAEPSERLGQFAAHRATAEDGQRFGWISQVEGGLGGQVRRVGEPVDRWHGRTRAGGDDDPTAPQAAAVDNNGVRARESGPSAQHVDPLPAQHLRGLSGRDPGDRGADPRQRVAERHSMRGSVDERLGRHASGEGAVPADLAPPPAAPAPSREPRRPRWPALRHRLRSPPRLIHGRQLTRGTRSRQCRCHRADNVPVAETTGEAYLGLVVPR